MFSWWRSIVPPGRDLASAVEEVRRLQSIYTPLDDQALREAGARAVQLTEVVAVTAVVASRVLGLQLFDVQLQAALALADGTIVEMQTGEGKTLAAVPAIVWHARSGQGVHVLTANDYLARRDAEWMGGIYRGLGLSVGVIQQGMTSKARHAAYCCDVTYATANEVGFDYLRDQLALHVDDQVLRPFAAALFDEADSALIDEARIPLVIAGGDAGLDDAPALADGAVRLLNRWHYTIDEAGRNVALTSSGIEAIEGTLGCGDLFAADGIPIMAAVQDALHAHTLLHRDVDYVVHDGHVLSVDEFKGRIVRDRRWPGGLQTALECKEGVLRKIQGRVLGSITVENLVALYPTVCGMTGTAATQARDFREMYGLEVECIPTHRPVIRSDHPDCLFDTKAAKEAAVLEEIRIAHAKGRPVLVGTSSVQESESLSQQLGDITHCVLNARNEEAEAAIIARAGERGAVTISTSMAGRGVDIRLGPGVAELGGLHVVGTGRYDSRRVDHQLRGRSGRQGDPGSSRFFVSREDTLMAKFGSDCMTPDEAQRIAEGQHLDVRLLLRKYESIVEGQRLAIAERRRRVLTGEEVCGSELERVVTLRTIDDLWADYLAGVSDLRAGTVWTSLGASNPFATYITRIHAMFQEFELAIAEELPARLAQASATRIDPRQRGATWTYLTTDEPFGPISERFMRGLRRRLSRK
jgi:preprotein translocase subunit SecA